MILAHSLLVHFSACPFIISSIVFGIECEHAGFSTTSHDLPWTQISTALFEGTVQRHDSGAPFCSLFLNHVSA
ncbi:hypothetical protein GGU10DRAFT_36196 [Lentinula aff. detonsa]|uniref:Secreted protein n=1 Tax=Lentinula aff. detonsa TaxID=2804958 RepID=A0AA38L3S0_9AGAR|nr:hypothetical protein GGU10DRAFT_36196 [Lentinula aff. detonsa]